MMKIKQTVFKIASILVVLFLSSIPVFAAELTLNLIAVNSSETETKELDLKYYLPRELEPNDVLDAAQLKIEYDVDRALYYIFGKINFAPKESKTIKIRVNDVWVITPEEIDVLKLNMNGNLALLENNPEVYNNAKRERDKIFEQLDIILTQQKNYSENIERRIEQYRAYATLVERIRSKIYDPNYLEKEAQVPDDISDDKTLRFFLQVKNPSDTEEKTIKHKHYLPEEIHNEDILDGQGFDVRYDEKKGKSFLSKEDTFGPGEEKKYEIVLRDIWRFPLAKLDPIEQRAKTAVDEIKGSAYEASSKFLFESLMNNVELIRETQSRQLAPEQHIGIFRTNGKRYEQAKQDVERIEQMLAIVKAKKLEELEGSKVKNVLKKLQALRGLQALSEAVFKKGITVTMTWKIITGAIFFLLFFTTYHFFVWSRRSGKMGEELALKGGEQIKIVPKPAPPVKHS